MKHLSSLIALALPLLVQAAPYGFTMSGDQFVQMMTHPRQMTDQQYAERDRAYRYLDGVRDAAIGKTWCPTQPRKTFELAYDAADYIRTLPADLRRGNAAQLLLTYLATANPCKEQPK